MPSSDTQFKPNTPRPANAGRRAGTPNHRLAALQAELIETSTLLIPDLLKTMDSLQAHYHHTPNVRAQQVFLNTLTQIMRLALPHGTATMNEPEDQDITNRPEEQTPTQSAENSNMEDSAAEQEFKSEPAQ